MCLRQDGEGASRPSAGQPSSLSQGSPSQGAGGCSPQLSTALGSAQKPRTKTEAAEGQCKVPWHNTPYSYASLTSASCLGIRNSPTGYCSKEGKRWRPEPKTQTEQINAGEFQEFSYVSPQQRRRNTSKGTTALSFPTQAVAIISIIHLRRELAFQ